MYRPLSQVKVGESVEYGYRGGWGNYLPQEILVVSEVGKNWLKTTDSRKWKFGDGREWGKNYGSDRICRFGPEDEASWAATRERNAVLGKFLSLSKDGFYKALSNDQIRRMTAILKEVQ